MASVVDGDGVQVAAGVGLHPLMADGYPHEPGECRPVVLDLGGGYAAKLAAFEGGDFPARDFIEIHPPEFLAQHAKGLLVGCYCGHLLGAQVFFDVGDCGLLEWDSWFAASV